MVDVTDIVDQLNEHVVPPPVNDGTSNYFYAAQLQALTQQILRVFSNFYYKTGINYTGDEQLLPIPCRYGDASRMVASIIQNNSQNTAISAPIFAVYIKDIAMSPQDRKFPVGEQQISVSERDVDKVTGRYTDELGSQYEVTRLMPVPYIVKFQVDFLFTNASQQWQIFEQVGLLFNPSISIQMNDNPLDWGSLTQMEMTDIVFNSKSIPIGTENPLNVMSFTFAIKPFWLSPPAKVKKLVEIRNIILDVGSDTPDCNGIITWTKDDFIQSVTTVGQNKVSLAGNELVLLGKNGNTLDENENPYSWKTLLGKTGNYDPATTIIRLRPVMNISDTSHDIIATFALDPNNVNVATLDFDPNTLPSTTIAAVNAFINPKAIFPGNNLPTPVSGTRYVITQDIIPNTVSWGSFSAMANSIIEFNGTVWTVASSVENIAIGTIVENLSNKKLYVLTSDGWVLCYEGQYAAGYWRIQFFAEYAK